MAIVTRKFTCKNCEETHKVTYEQEELKTKSEATKDGESLILFGLCKKCFGSNHL